MYSGKNPLNMLLALLLLCSTIFAAPIATTIDSLEATTTSSKVVGGLSILLGLFVAFFGYKLFRVNVEPDSGYSNRELLLLLVPFIVGLIGGFIAYKLWRFGLSLIGALGGAALAMIILSFGTNGLITSETGRIIFVIVCAFIGGAVIQFFEKPVIIGSTALLG
ncbi:hypothetical protein HDU91_000929, partial [Kappamyces sp. JEL0680]